MYSGKLIHKLVPQANAMSSWRRLDVTTPDPVVSGRIPR